MPRAHRHFLPGHIYLYVDHFKDALGISGTHTTYH